MLFFPVELEDGAVLPVPDHGGLHHLPESRLLRRGHQQSAQLVDAHAVRVEVQFVGALQRQRRK